MLKRVFALLLLAATVLTASWRLGTTNSKQVNRVSTEQRELMISVGMRQTSRWQGLPVLVVSSSCVASRALVSTLLRNEEGNRRIRRTLYVLHGNEWDELRRLTKRTGSIILPLDSSYRGRLLTPIASFASGGRESRGHEALTFGVVEIVSLLKAISEP